jgi:hypothetical protein
MRPEATSVCKLLSAVICAVSPALVCAVEYFTTDFTTDFTGSIGSRMRGITRTRVGRKVMHNAPAINAHSLLSKHWCSFSVELLAPNALHATAALLAHS